MSDVWCGDSLIFAECRHLLVRQSGDIKGLHTADARALDGEVR